MFEYVLQDRSIVITNLLIGVEKPNNNAISKANAHPSFYLGNMQAKLCDA